MVGRTKRYYHGKSRIGNLDRRDGDFLKVRAAILLHRVVIVEPEIYECLCTREQYLVIYHLVVIWNEKCVLTKYTAETHWIWPQSLCPRFLSEAGGSHLPFHMPLLHDSRFRLLFVRQTSTLLCFLNTFVLSCWSYLLVC